MFAKSEKTKSFSPFTLALAALPLALGGAACAVSPGEEELGSSEQEIVEINEDSTCVTLYAGQTIDAGQVCASVDNTVDTSAVCGAGSAGVLNVEFLTSGGWEIEEAHLAAGDDLADIPMNQKGNPKIGNFPYNSGDITGATSHSFSVPLCTFGLDAGLTECDPVNAFLAAHAALRKDNGDGTYQTETGWGDGDRFVQKGSWAEYFNMELVCTGDEEPPPPPEPASCETAFAYGDGDATCFIGADFDGDNVDDGISRWGWSNGPLSAGSYSWEVYAAAGQCDLTKGTLVGSLGVVYDGSSATVTFNRTGDFVLDEEHLYVGSEPLARDSNNEYTVAPGQYPLVIDLTDATSTSNVVNGLSGDIYVVYHAVACGSF